MTAAFARPTVAAGILAMLGVAACSSTGPATYAPLTVSLSGPSAVQGHDTTVGGVASYACDYRLTATANGGFSTDVATLEAGRSIYLAHNGTADTVSFSGAGLFAPYTTVPAGAQLSTIQHNVWTQPFQLSLVLYYSTLDQSTNPDSAAYSYTCQ